MLQGLISVMGAFDISFTHDSSILHLFNPEQCSVSIVLGITNQPHDIPQGPISVMGDEPKRPMTPTAERGVTISQQLDATNVIYLYYGDNDNVENDIEDNDDEDDEDNKD